jgi:hypothetical protein
MLKNGKWDSDIFRLEIFQTEKKIDKHTQIQPARCRRIRRKHAGLSNPKEKFLS